MLQRFKAILLNRIKLVFRDRMSLFFGFFFPLILVTVFGLLVLGTRNLSNVDVTVYIPKETERSALFLHAMSNGPFKVSESKDYDKSVQDLKDNKIRFLININDNDSTQPVEVKTLYNITSLSDYNQLVKPILEGISSKINYSGVKVPLNFVVSEGESVGAKINQEAVVMNGFILQSLVLYSVIGAASTISEEKQKNLLKRLGITRIRKIEYIIAYLLSFLIIGFVQSSILILFAKFVFSIDFYNIPLLMLAAVIVNALFSFMGIFVGTIAKNANAANGLANIIAFPLVIISGAWFSISFMPEWVQAISKYSPITAARTTFDQISSIATPDISFFNIVVLAVSMAIFLTLSMITLKFKK